LAANATTARANDGGAFSDTSRFALFCWWSVLSYLSFYVRKELKVVSVILFRQSNKVKGVYTKKKYG
jgi:hypothetical protein